MTLGRKRGFDACCGGLNSFESVNTSIFRMDMKLPYSVCLSYTKYFLNSQTCWYVFVHNPNPKLTADCVSGVRAASWLCSLSRMTYRCIHATDLLFWCHTNQGALPFIRRGANVFWVLVMHRYGGENQDGWCLLSQQINLPLYSGWWSASCNIPDVTSAVQNTTNTNREMGGT